MASAADVVKAINKKVGVPAVRMGSEFENCARIPTGVFELDLYTGGGVPEGKISIFFGMESSNKTNLSLLTARNDLLAHPKAVWVFIDVENHFDKAWAEKLGVPTDRLIVAKPDYGEQAVDMADSFLEATDVRGLIIDSLAMMIPESEAENTADRVQVGGNAKVISALMRKMTRRLLEAQVNGRYPTIICINQVRHKIGVNFGDPETQAGGNALRFQSGLTLRLYGKDTIVKEVDKELPTLKTTKVVVKKSKVPYLSRSFEFDLVVQPYQHMTYGDSNEWNCLFGQLKDMGWVERVGNKWLFNDEEFKSGEELRMSIYEDPDYTEQLKREVIKTRVEHQHGEGTWIDYGMEE